MSCSSVILSASYFNHDPQTKFPKRGTSCRSQHFQEHSRVVSIMSHLLFKFTQYVIRNKSYRRYGSSEAKKL
jgi:hypothetical protein